MCSFMKKLIVSILAFLYITSTCEATVYVHYCMGEQISFSFIAQHSGNCHKCGMKKSGGGSSCCRDEQKVLKSDPKQGLATPFLGTNFAKKITYLDSEYYSYSKLVKFSSALLNAFTHDPPGDHPVPDYLMNRILLI
jgi:hypothetical protein